VKLTIYGKIPSGNRRAIGKKNGKPFIFKTQQKEIKDIVLPHFISLTGKEGT